MNLTLCWLAIINSYFLTGVFNEYDLNEATELDCHLVLHDLSQLSIICSSQQPISVWLKVDTGMHRLGLSPSELIICLEQINNHSNIRIECIMSHFSCADELENTNTLKQLDYFNQIKVYGINRSIANSAAILSLPQSHFEYVRPGIMLYDNGQIDWTTQCI